MKRVHPALPVPRARTDWTGAADRMASSALEAVWLTAAAVVPLIVLSDHIFADFTGLPKITSLRMLAGITAALMLLRLAVRLVAWGWQESMPGPSLAQLRIMAVTAIRRPEQRLVLLAIASFAAVTISSLLSVAPKVSLWGWVAGQDNNNLYSSASYFVLFLSVATTLRTRAQVWRLWTVIAAATFAAAAIGIAQHFGKSPFGISNTMLGRLTGPSGNPIFFGSLLVLGTPLVLAASVALEQRRRHSWRWWLMSVACACALFLPMAWTIARGPWVGMLVAVPPLVTGLWLAAGKTAGFRVLAVLATAIAAVALIIVRPSVPVLDFSSPDQSAPSTASQPQPTSATQGGDRNQFFESHVAGEEGVYSALSRLEVSSLSLKIATSRPPIPDAVNRPWMVRSLFGYGPGTYQYAFQLVAPGKLLERLTASAHNDPLNILVETGVVGLAAYAALIASAAWLAFSIVRGKSGTSSPHFRLLAAGALAALAGRSAEQLFGIPQAGDNTFLWLLLGLLATLQRAAQDEVPVQTHAASRPPHYSPPAFTRKAAAALAVTTCVVLTAWTVHTGWARNINYLRADAQVHQGLQIAPQDPRGALMLFESGIALAPDVAKYYRMKSEVLRSLATASVDPVTAYALYREAYASDLAALNINPLWRDASFVAAYGAWELAKAGEPERALDAVAHYERLARIMPAHPLVQSRLDALLRAVNAASGAPAETRSAPVDAARP